MDNNKFSFSDVLGLIFGFSTIVTSIDTSIETNALQSTGASSTETSQSFAELGGGNSLCGTTGLCSVGVSLTGMTNGIDACTPGPDFIVETHDSNNYARTEKRAQEIYDKFHKGHNTSYKPPVLIAETPEAAEKLLEFMSQFKSKREMYIYLTALQRVIEEIRDEELEEKNKIEKNKTKTLEK